MLTVSVPLLLMPPPCRGAIAGEGAVAHGQRAAVGDAAAVVAALLPEKVLLLTVSVPSLSDAAAVWKRYCRRRCCCSRSPCRRALSECRRQPCDDAARSALLPEKVLLLTVSVPLCCRCRRRVRGAIAGEGAVAHGQRADAVVDAAAVTLLALLPEKVLLLTVSVPFLRMPPPWSSLPSATVSSFRLSVTPEFTVNTRTAWLPLMVTVCPLPSMVVSAAIAIVGCQGDRAAATEGHRAAAGQCGQQVRFVADADDATGLRRCGR